MQQEKIWTYYQNQAIDSFAGSRTRQAYLIKEIEKRHLQVVLNVGIGAGIFEQLAQEHGLQISSLDPDPDTVERLCKQLGVDAQMGYVQQMPFEDATFDTVVISEVLEHLDYDIMLQGFQEIDRVLVSGGYLIGTVPYQEDLDSNIVVCPYCGETFHRWGHLQSFSVKTMRDVLASFYKVERIFPRPFPHFSTLNWKGTIVELSRLLLWRAGIYGQGSRLVFIARKVSEENSC